MISLPYVWHLSSSFLNDQWVRDGVAVGVVVDLSLVAVRWTSSQLAGRAGLVKRTFFNHTEYVWNLVLFKSVKAGFLPLLLNDGVFGVGLQLPRRLRDVHFGGVLHMNRWLPCSRWCLPEEYRGLGWYLHRQCLWTLVPDGLPSTWFGRFLHRCSRTPCYRYIGFRLVLALHVVRQGDVVDLDVLVDEGGRGILSISQSMISSTAESLNRSERSSNNQLSSDFLPKSSLADFF